jgi:hypothetical protein
MLTKFLLLALLDQNALQPVGKNGRKGEIAKAKSGCLNGE